MGIVVPFDNIPRIVVLGRPSEITINHISNLPEPFFIFMVDWCRGPGMLFWARVLDVCRLREYIDSGGSLSGTLQSQVYWSDGEYFDFERVTIVGKGLLEKGDRPAFKSSAMCHGNSQR